MSGQSRVLYHIKTISLFRFIFCRTGQASISAAWSTCAGTEVVLLWSPHGNRTCEWLKTLRVYFNWAAYQVNKIPLWGSLPGCCCCIPCFFTQRREPACLRWARSCNFRYSLPAPPAPPSAKHAGVVTGNLWTIPRVLSPTTQDLHCNLGTVLKVKREIFS